ncbi:MAG: bacillithiol system redox-active protein YtxJ [Bacteroidia bacterium]|nr:bacillithiol system redox-active protein YtxJ [Bacteroidia bacterium]
MGLFKNIFKTSSPSEKKVLPWISLTHLEQLEAIQNRSHDKLQIIFKHSTRCGISGMVLNQFVDRFDLDEERVDLYYLDLLACRQLSDEVGYRFQVMHQSPQLLVIKKGEVIAHDSHGAINTIDLNRFKF